MNKPDYKLLSPTRLRVEHVEFERGKCCSLQVCRHLPLRYWLWEMRLKGYIQLRCSGANADLLAKPSNEPVRRDLQSTGSKSLAANRSRFESSSAEKLLSPFGRCENLGLKLEVCAYWELAGEKPREKCNKRKSFSESSLQRA